MDNMTGALSLACPGYYAVIPADVRYDDRLPANAKLLYGEISALISRDGFCVAGNGYFAGLYQLSERTITTLLAKLQELHYIDIRMDRDDATGQIQCREIWLRVSASGEHPVEENFYPPRKYFQGGIEENFQRLNNINNNIYNNINIKEKDKKEKPQGKKSPPTVDFDPLPLFVGWIRETLPDRTADEQNDLYRAIMRFCENRKDIKRPMKSKAAVTALCNRLIRYSGGSIPAMIDLLDTATSSGWQTVYPPKNQPKPQPQARRNEVWL